MSSPRSRAVSVRRWSASLSTRCRCRTAWPNAAGSAVTTPTLGVLALQGDVREHVAVVESCGAQAVRVRRPDELDRVDGLVVPGGESTTIGKLLVTFDLLEPLQKRVAGGMPAFGACAGMILLADRVVDGTADQAGIGGIDMTVRRNAFGRQVDSWEGDVPWRPEGDVPWRPEGDVPWR